MEHANIAQPQLVNRAYLALAVESGVFEALRRITVYGSDKMTLVIRLREEMEGVDPEFAQSINVATFDAMIGYLSTKADYVSPFVNATDLVALDDTIPVPDPVQVTRDIVDYNLLHVEFPAPPSDHRWEVYVNRILIASGDRPKEDNTVRVDIHADPLEKAPFIQVLYSYPLYPSAIGKLSSPVSP